ncbi:MAG TPA: hypothetical protein V6D29_02820 [Leptolyngbyaceae cyanobacterium]
MGFVFLLRSEPTLFPVLKGQEWVEENRPENPSHAAIEVQNWSG